MSACFVLLHRTCAFPFKPKKFVREKLTELDWQTVGSEPVLRRVPVADCGDDCGVSGGDVLLLADVTCDMSNDVSAAPAQCTAPQPAISSTDHSINQLIKTCFCAIIMSQTNQRIMTEAMCSRLSQAMSNSLIFYARKQQHCFSAP